MATVQSGKTCAPSGFMSAILSVSCGGCVSVRLPVLRLCGSDVDVRGNKPLTLLGPGLLSYASRCDRFWNCSAHVPASSAANKSGRPRFAPRQPPASPSDGPVAFAGQVGGGPAGVPAEAPASRVGRLTVFSG